MARKVKTDWEKWCAKQARWQKACHKRSMAEHRRRSIVQWECKQRETMLACMTEA